MKVIRIEDVDKINFDSIKAEFKDFFSKESVCDVKEISTLKDSDFLKLLIELWKNTSYQETIKKLSNSDHFYNFKKI